MITGPSYLLRYVHVLIGVMTPWVAIQDVSAETMVQALSKAYVANPVLQSHRWQVREAFEGRKRVLAKGWLPSVSGTLSGSREESKSFLPFSRTQESNATPWKTSLNVSIPLINPPEGGVSDLRAAHETIAFSQADYKAKEQAFLREAIDIFLACTTAQATLELSQKQVQNFEKDHEQKQIEFDLGAISRTELSRVEARLSDARGDFAKAKADLESARANYARLFGEEPSALQIPSLPKDSVLDLNAAWALAEKNNPVLQQAHADLRRSDAAVQASHMRLLPRVSLDGTLSRSHERPDEQSFNQPDRKESLAVGATMVIPLYNPEGYSQVRSSIVKQVSSRLGVEDTRRKLRQDVTAAFHALRAAEAGVEQYKISVKAAQDALEGTRLEAQMGARTFLDVLLSETDLQGAQLKLLQAQQKHLLAFYEMLRVQGELTPARLGMNVASFHPESDYQKNVGWLGFKEPKSARIKKSSTAKS